MPHPTPEFERYRALAARGLAVPARISATDLRRDLREALARIEYDGLRVEVLRQSKPVAALLPLADLRQLEAFERTGIRYAREHLALVAEMQRLRARMGA